MCDLLDGLRHPERFRSRISQRFTKGAPVKHGGYHYGVTPSGAVSSQLVWVQATPRPSWDRRL
jgi:hypothetical protein